MQNLHFWVFLRHLAKSNLKFFISLIADPPPACGYDTVAPPGGDCARTGPKQTSMGVRVQQHRYVNINPSRILRNFQKCKNKKFFILFPQRGLTTCGQFPYCLSKTSLITSVSPHQWVHLSHHYGDHGVACRCSRPWLILVFVFSSFTEWRELYQRWRLLVILRIPFPHWEQLFVRRRVLSRSPTFPLCGCLSDGIIVHFF